MVWLSVLVPVFNSEKFVEDCLRSIICQIDSSVELVIVDDCSTDNSPDIIKDCLKDCRSPYKLIRSDKNNGLSVSRNILLDAASGEHIWFIDSDDFILPGCVSKIKNIVEKKSPDWIIFDYLSVSENFTLESLDISNKQRIKTLSCSNNKLLFDNESLLCGLFLSGKLHIWSRVIRRKCWDESLSFPGGKSYEDLAILPRLATFVKSYYYAGEPWIAYRDSSKGIVNTVSIEKSEDMVRALDGLYQYISDHFIKPSKKLEFCFVLQCARVQINAIKMLRQLDCVDAERHHEYTQIFYKNINRSKLSIIFLYLRFGQIFRLFKLLRYL